MPDYSKGKVYRITSGDLTYIGSTCEPTLAKRLAKHVNDYKLWTRGGRRGISSFQLIETGQYEITLIELCPCGSKDELRARERFHIEANECVNKKLPGRTPSGYYIDKKDSIRERQKTYRAEHKEQIKEYVEANKEVIQERQTKYREEHREEALLYWKDYREKNKVDILEKAKAYREANKDKINAKQREARKSLIITSG